ncbi:MAG: NUDIX hydrolase, partial [Micromonosporaceae bacterium]
MGGRIDYLDDPEAPPAAVREVAEETGVHCEVTGIVGAYTNPRHVIHYTSDNGYGRSSRWSTPRGRSGVNRGPVPSPPTSGGYAAQT